MTSNGAELCTDLSNDVNLVIVDRADTKQEKLARKKFSQLATNDSVRLLLLLAMTRTWSLIEYNNILDTVQGHRTVKSCWTNT